MRGRRFAPRMRKSSGFEAFESDFTDLLSLPMKLGFFTMPMHPRERAPAQTLQEDREAILLADRLGFHDAFVGEHLTDPEENITSSLIFLASLLSETKTIKLATGTSNLSHSHPVLIAAHAAMFDHLAKGTSRAASSFSRACFPRPRRSSSRP